MLKKVFDDIQSPIIRNAELSHSDKEYQPKNHVYDSLMEYFYS